MKHLDFALFSFSFLHKQFGESEMKLWNVSVSPNLNFFYWKKIAAEKFCPALVTSGYQHQGLNSGPRAPNIWASTLLAGAVAASWISICGLATTLWNRAPHQMSVGCTGRCEIHELSSPSPCFTYVLLSAQLQLLCTVHSNLSNWAAVRWMLCLDARPSKNKHLAASGSGAGHSVGVAFPSECWINAKVVLKSAYWKFSHEMRCKIEVQTISYPWLHSTLCKWGNIHSGFLVKFHFI